LIRSFRFMALVFAAAWLVTFMTPSMARAQGPSTAGSQAPAAQTPNTTGAQAPAVSTSAQPASSSSAPAAPPSPGATSDPHEEAKAHFDRGVELLRENSDEAAYAEFMRSRELFASRGNTQNAAVALRRLHRYDESLDMFERLLAEFAATLSDEEKESVRREMVGLAPLVGAIVVSTRVTGARVIVDGRERGATPLPPVRVSAGSHSVRVFQEGYLPFDTKVDVAGGQATSVEAMLIALVHSGRLRVSEANGQLATVIVDGAEVGQAPWVGALAEGPHVVFLRGEGELATEPHSAIVRLNEEASLALALETLPCELKVQVGPVPGAVSVDGVSLGRGAWSGRLRAGVHALEASEEGFFPRRQEIILVAGEARTVPLTLERDLSSPYWTGEPTAHAFVELSGGAVLSPTLGGDAASSCATGCSSSLPTGFSLSGSGGYELPSGLQFAASVGYLTLGTRYTGRNAEIAPTGEAAYQGTVNDDPSLRGVLLAAAVGIHRGSSLVWTLRLGLGVLIGSVHDTVSGSFNNAGGSLAVGSFDVSASATYLSIDPQASLGYRLGSHFEIGLSVRATTLFALSKAALNQPWPSSGLPVPSNVAYFPPTSLAGSLIFAPTPSLYVGASF
jgi:hypothetical protein